MFWNHLTVAWRSMLRRKSFSFINILGLALGMAVCVLVLQYVLYQENFDSFHIKKDRIYRVVNERFQEGKRVQIGTITYPNIGPAMKKDFPEVNNYSRMTPAGGRVLVQYGNEIFPIERSLYVDENFLSVFSFPLLAGDPQTALSDKYTVVLTESEARRIFDIADGNFELVIGRQLEIDRDDTPYVVKGVCKDVPPNSFLQFRVLASFNTLLSEWDEGLNTNWSWSNFYHFLELHPGVDPKALEAKFEAFSRRYFNGAEVSGSEEKFFLQPLAKAHLHSSNLEYEIGQTGNRTIVWSLLIVGIMILIIAWMNYINLTTVRAFERAREVGVRKVMGSSKGQLAKQFFAEALLFNGIGLLIAIIIAETASPYFNAVLDTNISWAILFNQGISSVLLLSGMLGVFFLGVLLSGAYPALVLSSYKTINVLKGEFKHSGKGNRMRKILVAFQFTASIAFTAATIITYQQIRFLHQKDLGLNIEQTMIIRGPELSEWDSTFIDRTNTLKKQLSQYPAIHGAATSLGIPGDRLGRAFDFGLAGAPENEYYTTSILGVDYDFMDNYGVKLLGGRNFKPSDHNTEFDKLNNVLVNESVVRLLGFEKPEDILNHKIHFWNDKQWEVVGVVSDFHQESLKAPIEPIVFPPFYSTNGYLSLKISEENVDQTIMQIQNTYLEVFPNNAFDYFFLDERFNRQYQADYSFGKILGFFCCLAIIIACLGLFGLVSFAAVLRAKEMGVRKILGASPAQLFLLLTKDIAFLLVIGFIVAIPVTYYGISTWLSGFAYHIAISWWVFLLSGLMVSLIAFFSIGFRSLKATMANPVDSLRYE